MAYDLTEKDIKRFHTKYSVSDGCWNWTGTFHSKTSKYGCFCIKHHNKPAHRVSFEVFNGPISDGLLIRHSCDNPSCVNPSHLLEGTTKDNMDDRNKRMRHSYGEHRPAHKMTESEVLGLRALRKLGMDYRTLGLIYGVSHTNAMNAAKGKTWKHLPLI